MESTAKALSLLVATISFMGALLHVAGFYLLMVLKGARMSATQQCYLRHLSATEILLLTGASIKRIIMIARPAEWVKNVTGFHVLERSGHFSLNCMWYMSMFNLTVDRILAVYWNFKYPLHWSIRRANRLCIAQWTLSLTVGAVAMILHFVSRIEITDVKITRTIYAILDVALLPTVFGAYAYLFVKYAQSSKSNTIMRQARQNARCNHSGKATQLPDAQSLLLVFRGSKFWVASLILASFILLVVIPDLVHYYVTITKGIQQTSAVSSAVSLLFVMNCGLDAILYIILSPKVKKLLLTKLEKICCNIGSHRRIVAAKN